jgi:hypothetical protein
MRRAYLHRACILVGDGEPCRLILKEIRALEHDLEIDSE